MGRKPDSRITKLKKKIQKIFSDIKKRLFGKLCECKTK